MFFGADRPAGGGLVCAHGLVLQGRVLTSVGRRLPLPRTGNRSSALTRPAAIDLESNLFTARETQTAILG